jgi:hypothetical protein
MNWARKVVAQWKKKRREEEIKRKQAAVKALLPEESENES